MAVAINDIIQLTLRSVFAQQRALNVFHFRVTTVQTEFHMETYTDALITGIVADVAAITSSSVTYDLVEFKNLTNGLDIFSKAYSTVGLGASEALPPFVNYAFRYNRATGLTRHGQKRFMGVPEAYQANGVAVAAINTSLQQAASTMGSIFAEISQGARNFQAEPVIVGRTPNASGVYEIDLEKINTISGVQFVGISSQTSRKFGRGI